MADFSFTTAHNRELLQRIRVKCVERNTSIPKIEKALGYGNGAISSWKNAKRYAPIERVAAIADYLNVPLSELVDNLPTVSSSVDDFNAAKKALRVHGENSEKLQSAMTESARNIRKAAIQLNASSLSNMDSSERVSLILDYLSSNCADMPSELQQIIINAIELHKKAKQEKEQK